MKVAAAVRSALLAALFVAVYGGTNWMAAHRPEVGTWYFEWERQIPFWPAMIVPYLSIDAFFLAAPFLYRDRGELRVFSRRIVLAIIVAGAFFVLMPLRFAFERPAVGGAFGALLNGFATLDRPFNLFPSLHITLAVILADTYLHHTSGFVRVMITAWFVLVGASVLFVYQHHVIDVVGGLALAAMVFYFVRGPVRRHAAQGSPRLAAYYALGALTAGGLAALLWPVGILLFWPAASLAVVSAAYLGAGPWVFGKSNGRIGVPARLLLWPCLLGQRASLAYYRRRSRPYDAIAPNVWIGRRLDDDEAEAAVAEGVTAVVDLTAELDEAPAFMRVAYENCQVLDLTAPELDSLQRVVRFIVDGSRGGIVFVHCKAGYSRTAAVAGAYLLASGRARTAEDALAMIRGTRAGMVVRPEAVEAVRQFEAALGNEAARHLPRPSPSRVLVSAILGVAGRLVCGWPTVERVPTQARQRIYFANHTSHLDFLAVWGSLPLQTRILTRPVAGRDYWDRNPVRRYVARRMFRAVLVDRASAAGGDRTALVADARRSVVRSARALAAGASLIIFPEGTRGTGSSVGAFKSGLYHLCRMRPDVELVPVFLGNMHRVLPKGEAVPLPLAASVRFGEPIRLRPGETKEAFLARARGALLMVNRPCRSISTVMSRAS